MTPKRVSLNQRVKVIQEVVELTILTKGIIYVSYLLTVIVRVGGDVSCVVTEISNLMKKPPSAILQDSVLVKALKF